MKRAAFVNLDTLTWTEFTEATGGGGWHADPSAAPFMWAVWFTVDLRAAVFSTPDGDHRDLGVADVGFGTVISIPESIGSFSTTIDPIELNPPKGVVGVVLVLMNDGGHVTAHGIRAGHARLNQEVADLINALIPQAISPGGLSQADIEQAVANAKIADKVSQSVQDAQSFCENLWAASGADSEIGHVVATFDVSQFASPSETKSFELLLGQSPINQWTVKGTVTLTDLCPAKVSTSLLAQVFNKSSGAPGAQQQGAGSGIGDMGAFLALLRDFRDRKALLKEQSFADWWEFLKQSTPELACRLATRPDAHQAALALLPELVELIRDDERKLTSHFLEGCEKCVRALQRDATVRLGNDLRTLLGLLPRLKDRTLHEALRIAATRRIAVSAPKKGPGSRRRPEVR